MLPGQCACDDCGQPILRLFTVTGRLVELEPEPSDDGTRVIEYDLGRIRARTLTGPELPASAGTARVLHTCEVPAELGVRCPAPHCPRPLSPLLDAYHPECHPEVTDQLLAERRARIAAQFKRRRRDR